MSHLCNRKTGWVTLAAAYGCGLSTLPVLRKSSGPEVLFGAPLPMVEVWGRWLPLCCLVYSEEPRWPRDWSLKRQHFKCSQAKAYLTTNSPQRVVQGVGQGQVQPQGNGLQVYTASQLGCMFHSSCNRADVDANLSHGRSFQSAFAGSKVSCVCSGFLNLPGAHDFGLASIQTSPLTGIGLQSH